MPSAEQWFSCLVLRVVNMTLVVGLDRHSQVPWSHDSIVEIGMDTMNVVDIDDIFRERAVISQIMSEDIEAVVVLLGLQNARGLSDGLWCREHLVYGRFVKPSDWLWLATRNYSSTELTNEAKSSPSLEANALIAGHRLSEKPPQFKTSLLSST